jgi:hypothetical protein
MYKLGSNSFYGYCICAIKMNFKALLKDEIKHFRELACEGDMSYHQFVSFKKRALVKLREKI